MFSESRRIHLVEEILRLKNEDTLAKLETILEQEKHIKPTVKSAHDFVGLWSKEDSKLITKAIEEGCEQINADDWK